MDENWCKPAIIMNKRPSIETIGWKILKLLVWIEPTILIPKIIMSKWDIFSYKTHGTSVICSPVSTLFSLLKTVPKAYEWEKVFINFG